MMAGYDVRESISWGKTYAGHCCYYLAVSNCDKVKDER